MLAESGANEINEDIDNLIIKDTIAQGYKYDPKNTNMTEY